MLAAAGLTLVIDLNRLAVTHVFLEWVDWFNNRHLLEPIGNIPSAEAEKNCYAMLDEPTMAA